MRDQPLHPQRRWATRAPRVESRRAPEHEEEDATQRPEAESATKGASCRARASEEAATEATHAALAAPARPVAINHSCAISIHGMYALKQR